jgi:hypothetical protein
MFRSRSYIIFVFSLYFHVQNTFSQIGAEAQGGKMTTWLALGIDQKISKNWLLVTDFGYGRHSDPNNFDLFKRQGLNVVTQDFIFKPNNWSYAFGIGYWRRNFYSDDAPFDKQTAPFEFRNEVRPYQRVYYHQKINNIKVSHSVRTDYRFYYTQDFKYNWSTPFEFRLRLMESWKIPFTKNLKNWVILVDEGLSAIDRRDPSKNNWSPYQFTENRLSLYYRRSFFDGDVELDIGMMHQYWRDKPGVSTFNISYNFMVDIIIKNIINFQKKRVSE